MDVRSTPKTGAEKETLVAFLENNRAIMVWKLEGVSEEDARRPMVESGTSLLGLLKHLGWVERWWFEHNFAGKDVDFPWSDDDRDADFRVEDDESIADIITRYEAAVRDSNAIIDIADLDDVSQRDDRGPRSLRWILGHMIEETARHAGHADIVRELIDGKTGYMPRT
ncbi:MAG: DinB family protein [Acidimicrobiia bacterium]|nr:MAG: DinB family protein [Acidimicrobiia bacterium]